MIQHSCSARAQCPISAFGSQASVVGGGGKTIEMRRRRWKNNRNEEEEVGKQ